MKNRKVFIMVSLLSVLLVGMSACSNSTQNESNRNNTNQSTEDSSLSSGSSTDSKEKSDSKNENNGNEPSANSSNEATTENASKADETIENDKEEEDSLSQYSSQQIEYARIWLQLGPNQEIDGLYVRHIPAGTPLNPDDETSASYPEDVIQLAGSRLVDGSVTYSGNGDGTINIYNVPVRWDGIYPAGEQFYKDIIETTKLVSVETGENEKVIELIKMLK